MKEITIYDIAVAVGVSPSTVSRALKGSPLIKARTTEKIIDTARKMGYRHNKFASSLRKRNSSTIGIIVPKLNSYFMAAAIAGIEKVSGECNYSIVITQSKESELRQTECIETLFSGRVDGLLVSLASDTKELTHFEMLIRAGIPVVFFDRTADLKGSSSIVIDNSTAAFEITSHLIERGCRKIFFLGGNLNCPVYFSRFSGFRKALEKHGLSFSGDLMMETELGASAGEMVAARIISMKEKPDALFCSNDTSAVYAILSLQKAGFRIPRDIAVAGFNNDPVSRIVRPELTTINYPAREIGEKAASILLEKIAESRRKTPSRIVLEHELIVRQSTLK